jgi:hypothetical protein
LNRLEVLQRFYASLEDLRQRTGGPFFLSECSGSLLWPRRGVYLFFEPGEIRSDSGDGPRVVRVGTHALGANSVTTLWNRLSQHAGSRKAGAGNHRGSIFRLLVGEAMKRREGMDEPRSWGIKGHASKAADYLKITREQVKASELSLEQAVSRHIGAMPFLFVAVGDDSGPASARGVIERNAIALLSNFERPPVDPATKAWLGNMSGRERVRGSGLWNNNHVDEACDEAFLDVLKTAVEETSRLMA